MILKDFQIKAVGDLSKTFLELWKTENKKLPIVFKGPTGSGKTIMIAEFLRCLDKDYNFNVDKAYLWISFSEDSYEQSKDKLYHYFNEGTALNLKDMISLNPEEKLYKNNVFFINWQKLKATDKEGKKLRANTERTEIGLFDDFIKNTQKDNRELILLIDEAHTQTGTNLSDEIINLIDPKIIIKITATPKEKDLLIISDVLQKKAGFIEVSEEDVKREGLIKVSTIIQTEEEIKQLENKNLDESLILLELAYNRREELQKLYKENQIDVNPLVLIQLPNDYEETKEVQDTKLLRERLNNFLVRKGVKDYEIATWLSKEKENLDLITHNQDEVKFLFFKQAIATGWDCPRAQILIMYREIKTPTFQIQTLGRIRRMPEAKHYEESKLNKCYVYTNYNKSQIKDVKIPENENKPVIYFVKKKEDVKPIELKSIYHKRIDFNTITPPNKWQQLFLKFMDKEYGIITAKTNDEIDKKIIEENKKKLKNKKLILDSSKIDNEILISKEYSEIESYDNFYEELKAKTKDKDFHFSINDEEKLYNLLVFQELKDLCTQEDRGAHFNPSRSWGQLKQALNVWFMSRLAPDREEAYRMLIRNLKNPIESALKNNIKSALIKFNDEVYQTYLRDERQKEETFNLKVPQEEKSFTDDFKEKKDITKNVYDKFFIRKNYLGKKNEVSFINFLEKQKNILWWHKQEDFGREEFAVLYYNEDDKKDKLFYPDFIIRAENKVYILDTKKDMTLKNLQTKNKAEALQKWIKKNQKEYSFEIIGGIINFSHPNWTINKKNIYNHNNLEDFEILEF